MYLGSQHRVHIDPVKGTSDFRGQHAPYTQSRAWRVSQYPRWGHSSTHQPWGHQFRSLDPRISEADSHYFALSHQPRSLITPSRPVQEDPVYSTIDESGSLDSLDRWSQSILDVSDQKAKLDHDLGSHRHGSSQFSMGPNIQESIDSYSRHQSKTFQSLPYLLHQEGEESDELVEYARKYESNRHTSRRTPVLSTTNRTDVWSRRDVFNTNSGPVSGRDSAKSDSSSETLRYQESIPDSINYRSVSHSSSPFSQTSSGSPSQFSTVLPLQPPQCNGSPSQFSTGLPLQPPQSSGSPSQFSTGLPLQPPQCNGSPSQFSTGLPLQPPKCNGSPSAALNGSPSTSISPVNDPASLVNQSSPVNLSPTVSTSSYSVFNRSNSANGHLFSHSSQKHPSTVHPTAAFQYQRSDSSPLSYLSSAHPGQAAVPLPPTGASPSFLSFNEGSSSYKLPSSQQLQPSNSSSSQQLQTSNSFSVQQLQPSSVANSNDQRSTTDTTVIQAATAAAAARRSPGSGPTAGSSPHIYQRSKSECFNQQLSHNVQQLNSASSQNLLAIQVSSIRGGKESSLHPILSSDRLNEVGKTVVDSNGSFEDSCSSAAVGAAGRRDLFESGSRSGSRLNKDELSHSKSVPNLMNPGLGVEQRAEPESGFSFLDPEKRHKVSDNTIKMIQKQAVIEYYNRQRSSTKEKRQSGSQGNSERRTWSRRSERGRGDQEELGTRENQDQSSSLSGPAMSGVDGVDGVRSPTPEPPPPPDPAEGGELVCDDPLPPPPLHHQHHAHTDQRMEVKGDCAAVRKPVKPEPNANPELRRGHLFRNRRGAESPARAAARQAAGWEKFLGSGGLASTSADLNRQFRRDKTKESWRTVDSGAKSLSCVLDTLNLNSFSSETSNLHSKHSSPLNRSSPSLNRSSPPLTEVREPWWTGNQDHPSRGFELRSDSDKTSHSHSNSDSGLSSLSGRTSGLSSGRTSCLSPLSILSSSSASSGSSRASLRSASIVSSSTIPLEEEEYSLLLSFKEVSSLEDDLETVEACQLFVQTFNPNPETSLLLGVSPVPLRSPSFYLCQLFSLDGQPASLEHPQLPNQISNPDLVRENLVNKLEDSLSKLNALKTSGLTDTELNEERKTELINRLKDTATKSQVDKLELQVEDSRMICLLLVSLACRLAKTYNSISIQTVQGEIESLKRKEDQLMERFKEAQNLKRNVDKRVQAVSALVLQLLGERDQALHGLYMRCKVQLLIQQRLLVEKIQTTEQQLAALKSF